MEGEGCDGGCKVGDGGCRQWSIVGNDGQLVMEGVDGMNGGA